MFYMHEIWSISPILRQKLVAMASSLEGLQSDILGYQAFPYAYAGYATNSEYLVKISLLK